MIRKLAVAVTLLCCLAVLTGCNTVKGFGKDVKKLGEKIEDTSE
jgi:predicted small secreted protein